jgi:hypothetical protein
MYNLDPNISFEERMKTPCRCGCNVMEWNGHDGIWECFDCGVEVEEESHNDLP